MDWTDPDQSSEKENEAFERAMSLTGKEFLDVSFLSYIRIVSFLIWVIFTSFESRLSPNIAIKVVIDYLIFETYLENVLTFGSGFDLRIILSEVLTIIIFVQNVRHLARSWLPARSIVLNCLEARLDLDPSGELMVLDKFCPVSKSYLPIKKTKYWSSVCL